MFKLVVRVLVHLRQSSSTIRYLPTFMMLTTTTTRPIAVLAPGDAASPIEIKVLRKWISFGGRSECCFLFVDRHGDGIQASASSTDQSYFQNLIKVGCCYRVSNYICEPAKPYMRSVPHDTGIRIGKAAVFQQICDDGFPEYCFHFVAYDDLLERDGKTGILTDYIGKYEHITDPLTRQRSNMVKMKVENLSGKVVEVTFWNEIGLAIDKQSLMELPPPVIVAIASTKVTSYNRKPQLESTSGTYLYVNPKIPEAELMAKEFVARGDLTTALTVKYEKSGDTDIEKVRNRFTLATLLTQNPSKYMGTQFTCVATIKDIDKNRGWFYRACDQCRKKLHPQGNSFVCEDHQPVLQPKNLYFFTTTISDDTGESKVVFFDNAGMMLIGSECKAVIEAYGHADPYMLPEPVASVKGTTRILQMRYSNSSRPGNIDFVVDHVFNEPVTMAVQSIAPTDSVPTGPSTPVALHGSSSHSAENKRTRNPAVKKELFSASDIIGVYEVKKQKKVDDPDVSTTEKPHLD